MKAKLKKINIAGSWIIVVDIHLHAESLEAINEYLSETKLELEKQVKAVGLKDKHKVNVKRVKTYDQTHT